MPLRGEGRTGQCQSREGSRFLYLLPVLLGLGNLPVSSLLQKHFFSILSIYLDSNSWPSLRGHRNDDLGKSCKSNRKAGGKITPNLSAAAAFFTLARHQSTIYSFSGTSCLCHPSSVFTICHSKCVDCFPVVRVRASLLPLFFHA